jgi:hypothetical protein
MESLYKIALEKVLKQGIPYGHLMPHPVVKDLTHFFFREMFVELADQLEELVYNCIDPDADAEDKNELLRILRTFGVVEKRYGIGVEERFIQSTYGLINIAEHLVEVVQPLHFREFTQFLEHLVVLFIDESFNLPSHEHFTDEYILYHLRMIII